MVGNQVKHALLAYPQFQHPVHQWEDLGSGSILKARRAGLRRRALSCVQNRQLAPDAFRRRLKPLPQRLQRSRVRRRERAGYQLRRESDVRLQLRQVAVALQLPLGEMLGARQGRLPQFAVARQRVEKLIVKRRRHKPVKPRVYFVELGLQQSAIIVQLIQLLLAALDGIYVEDKRVRARAYAVKARVGAQRLPRLGIAANIVVKVPAVHALLQRRQLRLKGVMRLSDFPRYALKVIRRSGCQTRPRAHQRAAVLRHAESRHQLRYAVVVHAALRVANLVERKPPDKTSRNRQRHRAANGDVELRRDAIAVFKQAFPPACHRLISRLSRRCAIVVFKRAFPHSQFSFLDTASTGR